MINTTQQVGGSIGTALLNTVATTATISYIRVHGPASVSAGSIHGYAQAFIVGGAFLLVALAAVWSLITMGHLAGEQHLDGDLGAELRPTMV
jgi:hypothetical protein